ncbi:hypothetical protein VNO77_02726 [Canavalia gladiata]|uniref:Uncharacterized protein n=1 Tax=Canavalia gladiata TaxID=3824 RepID=A0AAN9MU62_CANGL
MKHHLVGTKENVSVGPSIPHDVNEMMMKLLKDKQKAKEATSKQCFEELDGTPETRKGETSSTTIKPKTKNKILKDRDLVVQDICKCINDDALPLIGSLVRKLPWRRQSVTKSFNESFEPLVQLNVKKLEHI